MARFLALTFLVAIAFVPVAQAEILSCQTSVDGELVQLQYDDDEALIYENMTFREIFFDGWGEIDCPAFVTMRHVTPELTDQDRAAFCLQFDHDRKTYIGFDQGERDAYLVCTQPSKTLCERVNASKDAAIAIAGLGAGASGGATAAASAAGVTAVTHSSGAVILTGASGYIAGTLGTIGAAALAVLTAPATLTAAVVSVVTVGGAVYICK